MTGLCKEWSIEPEYVQPLCGEKLWANPADNTTSNCFICTRPKTDNVSCIPGIGQAFASFRKRVALNFTSLVDPLTYPVGSTPTDYHSYLFYIKGPPLSKIAQATLSSESTSAVACGWSYVTLWRRYYKLNYTTPPGYSLRLTSIDTSDREIVGSTPPINPYAAFDKLGTRPPAGTSDTFWDSFDYGATWSLSFKSVYIPSVGANRFVPELSLTRSGVMHASYFADTSLVSPGTPEPFRTFVHRNITWGTGLAPWYYLPRFLHYNRSQNSQSYPPPSVYTPVPLVVYWMPSFSISNFPSGVWRFIKKSDASTFSPYAGTSPVFALNGFPPTLDLNLTS